MEKKTIFLLVGVFWLIIILGFVIVKEFTLQTGEEVLLKTRPVDPRDLFRGDYVVLRYEISTLDLDSIPTDYTGFENGGKIYIGLSIEEGYGVPSKIYRNPPKEGLYLKGTVKDVRNNMLNVEYGIENYFVPEGEGRAIERQTGGNLDVKVSIDKFGNAGIKTLLIDGQEVDFKS